MLQTAVFCSSTARVALDIVMRVAEWDGDEDAPQPEPGHPGLPGAATPWQTPRAASSALAPSSQDQDQASQPQPALASSQEQPQALASSQGQQRAFFMPVQILPVLTTSTGQHLVEIRQGEDGSMYKYNEFRKLYGKLAAQKWQDSPRVEMAPLAENESWSWSAPGQDSLGAHATGGAMPPSLHAIVEGDVAQGNPSASQQQKAAQLQPKLLQPRQGTPPLNVKALPPTTTTPAGGPGLSQPPAPQPVAQAAPAAPQVPKQPAPAAPQAPAQPATQPPAASAASQVEKLARKPKRAPPGPELPGPAGPALAPGGRTWQETGFFCELVVSRDAFKNALVNAAAVKAGSARNALELARGDLYEQLPLLDDCFTDHLKEKLDVPDALFVTAERIPRVKDASRPWQDRVDFFAYMLIGEVHRYHPGKRGNQSARVQVMRLGSPLFQFDVAATEGVGRALHIIPPGFASVPSRGNGNYGRSEVFAFTMEHRALYSFNDMLQNSPHMLANVVVKKAADHIPGNRGEIDITDGRLFPWWLALGLSAMCTDVIQDGIYQVKAIMHDNQQPHLIIRTGVGLYRVNLNRGVKVLGPRPA